MKKVVIYAEGGLKLGMGNIYRSMSLAASLVQYAPVETVFVTTSPAYIVEKIVQNGFICQYATEHDLEHTIIKTSPDLLIIDVLGVEGEFVKRIKEATACKVAIIGNLNAANDYADLVVNAIIGTDFSNRDYTVTQTHFLTGPRYLVLRDEFERFHNHYTWRNDLKKITLLFGGTDCRNHTCAVLRELIQAGDDYEIKVVIGRGFEYDRELDCLVAQAQEKHIHILRDITNVSEVLQDTDFLLTSPGTALFEAFWVGVPALALFQSPSQQNVFRDFVATYKIEDIDVLSVMNRTYAHYPEFKKRVDVLQIGQGKPDIIRNLINLIR